MKQRSWLSTIFVVILLTLSLMFATSLVGVAQRATPTPDTPNTPTPEPTATTVPDPDDGDKNDDDDGPPPPPAKEGTVHGYVYNYANANMPQANIGVKLSGAGWEAETVTNTDGYYVFAGLGEGKAVINVMTPPDAGSVMPDWPVDTSEKSPAHTNLGFYWGERPPLPVELSAAHQMLSAKPGTMINMQATVQNNSGGEASNGTLAINVPAGLMVQNATATNGETDFVNGKGWVTFETLADGESIVLHVEALVEEDADGAVAANTTFTYDEQITPQLVPIEVTVDGQAVMMSDAETTAAETTDTTAETETTSETDKPQKKAESTTDATESDVEPATAESESLIPETGQAAGSQTAAWIGILLSLLVIGTLLAAGFKAFANRA